jgi:hypothetical protein
VNTTNIKNIIPELFAENIVRGRGLLCRSIIKAQMVGTSTLLPRTPFALTHFFCALVH